MTGVSRQLAGGAMLAVLLMVTSADRVIGATNDLQEASSVSKNDMVGHMFKFDPGMGALWGNSAPDLKVFLTRLGVDWPAGSTMRYWQAEGLLSVENTPQNVLLLQRILEVDEPICRQVMIDMQMVAFQAVEIEKLLIRNDVSLESLTALWATGSGKLIACPRVVTRSGNEATVRGVKEFIYPTDFGSYSVIMEGTNVTVQGSEPIPQNFETREVGAIFSVIPEVSPEGNMINLNLRPEWVGMPEWVDYGTETTGAATNRLPMRQPVFYRHAVETQVSLADGARVLLGGGVPGQDKDTLIFTFVRARLVDTEGKPVLTIRGLRDQKPLPAKAP